MGHAVSNRPPFQLTGYLLWADHKLVLADNQDHLYLWDPKDMKCLFKSRISGDSRKCIRYNEAKNQLEVGAINQVLYLPLDTLDEVIVPYRFESSSYGWGENSYNAFYLSERYMVWADSDIILLDRSDNTDKKLLTHQEFEALKEKRMKEAPLLTPKDTDDLSLDSLSSRIERLVYHKHHLIFAEDHLNSFHLDAMTPERDNVLDCMYWAGPQMMQGITDFTFIGDFDLLVWGGQLGFSIESARAYQKAQEAYANKDEDEEMPVPASPVHENTRTLQLWQWPRFQLKTDFGGYQHNVQTVARLPERPFLITGGKELLLWHIQDLTQPKILKRFEGFQTDVLSVAFLPSLMYFFSIHGENRIYFWFLKEPHYQFGMQILSLKDWILWLPDGHFAMTEGVHKNELEALLATEFAHLDLSYETFREQYHTQEEVLEKTQRFF